MKPWEYAVEPFRITDDLFFVGNIASSSHLIVTNDGLAVLDSGYPQTLYLLLESIRRLGFSPYDIKYIIHSHGHYDHLGATRALVELTGAKTFIGMRDVPMATGENGLEWANELGYNYDEKFNPDKAIRDGEILDLGGVKIKCISTPGHTEGTMSYFFDVHDRGKTYRAGMHGGVGMNTLNSDYIKEHNLPASLRDDFLKGLERLKNEKVEVFLGNHVGNNHTIEKSKLIGKQKDNPFVCPDEWIPFLESCRANLLNTK